MECNKGFDYCSLLFGILRVPQLLRSPLCMKMYEVFCRQVCRISTIKLLLRVSIFGNMLWIPHVHLYIHTYRYIYRLILYIMCVDTSRHLYLDVHTLYETDHNLCTSPAITLQFFKNKTMTQKSIFQVIQSDLFIPGWRSLTTFERVTFSPFQKGHQQNCQVNPLILKV